LQNEDVYKPVDSSDPRIVELAESIREHGLLTPITITTDGVILSGHRRHCAARLAGLETVPVVVDAIASNDPEFLARLVAANKQREKTLDEVLAESVVESKPEEAYRELLLHRHKRSQIDTTNRMAVGVAAKRCKLTKATQPHVDAIMAVLERLEDFWPLSVRQIHYQLLNDPPLRHASKPDSVYRNDDKSYSRTTDVCLRARLEGLIPWEAIHDPTRPVTQWSGARSAGDFIRREFDGFLKGYYRDLMQSQPNHIEVVGEKNTVESVLRPVCSDYTIPLTISRGFCSGPPRKEIADRFERSGKEKLVLILLTDHDPDGTAIAQSMAASMQDEFGIGWRRFHAERAALTHDQVKRLGLPPSTERAKATSSNYGKFVSQFGSDVYELEAVPPVTLQQLLRDTINAVIDHDAFQQEMVQERVDAAEIANVRKRVQAAMGRQ
jgi:hypothetical protein